MGCCENDHVSRESQARNISNTVIYFLTCVMVHDHTNTFPKQMCWRGGGSMVGVAMGGCMWERGGGGGGEWWGMSGEWEGGGKRLQADR